jgi:hypothetical protein
MKKLLTLALLLLLGGSLDAQKRSMQKQVLLPSRAKKEKQKAKEKVEVKSELDPNTRAWLHEIRVKIYGFDLHKKDGKGGC